MALAIDGSPVAATGTTTVAQALPGLTTTHGSDIIIVVAQINGGTVTSITDTAGLSWQQRAISNSAGLDNETWWALAPSALSGAVITVNMTPTPNFNGMAAFAVSGANINKPWDANAILPVTSVANAPVVVSTSSPNAMIIGAYRGSNGTNTAGAGFTLIAGANFGLVEYQIAGPPQTSLSVPVGSIGTVNGAIGDALVPAIAWPHAAVTFR